MKRDGRFRAGDDARERGRRGGQVSGAGRRKTIGPWTGSRIELFDLTDMRTWVGARAFVKAISGPEEPLTGQELELYQRHSKREQPPMEAVDEAILMCGTGAGKTRLSGFLSVCAAITFDPTKAAGGESVVIPLLARSMDQARNAFNYVLDFCKLPLVAPYVHQVKQRVVELRTGVNIECMPASFRSVRGYSNASAVLDEIAYWLDEGANPDAEIVNAIKTRLARVPGSQLLILSSPHAPRGVLHQLHEAYFGRDEESRRDKVLFWNASTLAMRPDHPKPHAIEKAFRLDPASAIADYGLDGFVQFRQHSQAVFEADRVDPLIVTGRHELPPQPSVNYVAFLDASQGRRNGDSLTLAIAHGEDGNAVLDLLIELTPPFSPADVLVNTVAPALHRYGVTRVVGDRHAIGFVEGTLRGCGIRYEVATLDKAGLYLQFLNLVNSGVVELLDLPTLRLQLLALQRYDGSGGKERVDHPSGAHDDCANAAAGCLTLVSGVGARAKTQVYFSGQTRNQTKGKFDLAAMAKRINRTLDRRAARDAALAELYKNEPMIGEAIWHVHKPGR